MDKSKIIQSLIAQIETDLEQATEAAIESAESATHEESRSEGKYDTRSLETSYLASGHARHAVELRNSLEVMRNFTLPLQKSSSPVALGSLVTTLSGTEREVFFIAPVMGGLELEIENVAITVISSKSPLGSELIGKAVGDRVASGGGKTLLKVE